MNSFEYSDEGFTVTYEELNIVINWADITEINVFKRDMFTVDRIEMRIVYGDKQLTVSEDLLFTLPSPPTTELFIIKINNKCNPGFVPPIGLFV